MGVGVRGPPLNTNWSGRVLQAISSVMIRIETTVPEGSDGNGGGEGRNSATVASTVKPRAIIAKLLSRRTKTRIIDNSKKLKQYYQSNRNLPHIYIADDLTKKNGNLAFQARRLKTLKHISDTFVTNSKVFIKDDHGHIKQITSQMDIDRYAQWTCWLSANFDIIYRQCYFHENWVF